MKYRELIDDTINLLLSKYSHKIKNLTIIEGSTEKRIKSVKQALSL
jgi:hypothetical protein